MADHNSAIAPAAPVLPTRVGLGWGLLGVVAFSFTVPLTRLATAGGLSPLFVGAGRAVVAAALAAVVLTLTRQRRPSRRQWARLLVVAGGVVVGFPLLTSYAMVTAPASHGAVVIGLLPAATACAAVLRSNERVAGRVWVFSCLGAVAVMAFAAVQNDGFEAPRRADILLVAAVVVAAAGYAEGGLLSRELGSWQTVSWALLLAAPLMVPLAAGAAAGPHAATTSAGWLAFAYLSVVSMYLGFFAWYRGLAAGPMARVSQVQLVQPILSVCWAVLVLHERLTWATVCCGVLVIGCAGLAVRARQGRKT